MGNLEKAGVLVVVALLAVILVVAFLNFPDQNGKNAPVLNASSGKMMHGSDLKNSKPKPEPVNVYPDTPASTPDVGVKPDSPGAQEDWKILPERRDAPIIDRGEPSVALPEGGKNAKPAPPEVVKDTPAAVPATPGYPKSVKVASGDTLWLIAVREYGAKVGPRMVSHIADANPRVRPEALKAGTEIALPAPPAELADASSKSDSDKPQKKISSAPEKKTASPPPAIPKPGRKLPFVPN